MFYTEGEETEVAPILKLFVTFSESRVLSSKKHHPTLEHKNVKFFRFL
jgi:hypothetical protein